MAAPMNAYHRVRRTARQIRRARRWWYLLAWIGGTGGAVTVLALAPQTDAWDVVAAAPVLAVLMAAVLLPCDR